MGREIVIDVRDIELRLACKMNFSYMRPLKMTVLLHRLHEYILSAEPTSSL